MQLTVCIESPYGEYYLSCTVHFTRDANERHIEAEYYKKWVPDNIPQGDHHELEILTYVYKKFPAQLLHYHINPDTQKVFVCWTGSVPTLDDAKTVFKMWCLGAVYSMNHEKEFGHLFNGSFEKFSATLENQYKIKVKSITERP